MYVAKKQFLFIPKYPRSFGSSKRGVHQIKPQIDIFRFFCYFQKYNQVFSNSFHIEHIFVRPKMRINVTRSTTNITRVFVIALMLERRSKKKSIWHEVYNQMK